MTTQQFLVRIAIDSTAMDDATRDQLRNRESHRARQLADQGHLNRLWRIPGRWENVGIWSAENEQHLRWLIDSLPLRPYMTLGIEALDKHPNDPKGTATTALADPKANGWWQPPELPPLKSVGFVKGLQPAPGCETPLSRQRALIELPPLPALAAPHRRTYRWPALATGVAAGPAITTPAEDRTPGPRGGFGTAAVEIDLTKILRLGDDPEVLIKHFGNAAEKAVSTVLENQNEEFRDINVFLHTVAGLQPLRAHDYSTEATKSLTVMITHSGAQGLTHATRPPSPATHLVLDLGAARRQVTVLTDDIGSDRLMPRTLATATASYVTDAISDSNIATILTTTRSTLEAATRAR
jgi:muconolactone D-isomerase